MNRRRRKELKRQWHEGQRAAARAELPLPFDDLKALFDKLDTELPRQGCDHTRRLTRRWLEGRGQDAEPVFAWLDRHNGFCDCEILANVEQYVDQAMLES